MIHIIFTEFVRELINFEKDLFFYTYVVQSSHYVLTLSKLLHDRFTETTVAPGYEDRVCVALMLQGCVIIMTRFDCR